MRPRVNWLVAAFLSCTLAALPHAGMAKMPPPVLSGGDLPYPITLPFIDWETYYTATPPPKELEAPPSVSEQAYTLTSWYWSDIAQWALDEEDRNLATYYPLGGYLHVQTSSGARWFQLDQKRQILLGRYLRLGRERIIPGEPSMLQVAAAAAVAEPVVLEIGRTRESERVVVPPELARAFWQEAGATVKLQLLRSNTLMSGKDRAFDLFIRLPEGQVLSFWYDRAKGVLLDPTGIRFGWGQLDAFHISAAVMRPLEDLATRAGVAYPSFDAVQGAIPGAQPVAQPVQQPAPGGSRPVLLPAMAVLAAVAGVALMLGRRRWRQAPAG